MRADQPPEPDDEPLLGAPGSPEDEKRLRDLEDQLAATPAEVIVANHCYGMFELAALHMGRRPPQLEPARLAIDALGALVDGLQGRLGDHEQQLRDGLAQIRLAFVQIRAADEQGANPKS